MSTEKALEQAMSIIHDQRQEIKRLERSMTDQLNKNVERQIRNDYLKQALHVR